MIPTIEEFDPRDIPWQYNAIKEINSYDYKNGALDVFFSGSVGSAKTILACHLIALHAIQNRGAQILVGRKVLRELKNTIWADLLKHVPMFYQYWNKSEMKITLPNKSIIYGMSWDENDPTDKFKSYNLSMAVIEEASENASKVVYDAIRSRIGRAGVKKNLMILLSNPSGPSHWCYKDIIQREDVKTFYSVTTDNPFLPPWYVEQLKNIYDEKMALRMIYGQWVEITQDQIYYNYSSDNLRSEYTIDPKLPLAICHDFNIGKGKPMSCAIGQKIGGVYHTYKAFKKEGFRTQDILELAYEEIKDHPTKYIQIYGDASGRNNDTRSIRTDYDIIEEFWQSKEWKYDLNVPRSNPPLRRRHNTMNALFKNANNRIRFYCYDKWVDESFRLTTFKDSGKLIEDDSLPQQHIGTAVGYWCDYEENLVSEKSATIRL